MKYLLCSVLLDPALNQKKNAKIEQSVCEVKNDGKPIRSAIVAAGAATTGVDSATASRLVDSKQLNPRIRPDAIDKRWSGGAALSYKRGEGGRLVCWLEFLF